VTVAARHAANAAGLAASPGTAPLRTGLGRSSAGYAPVRRGRGVTGRYGSGRSGQAAVAKITDAAGPGWSAGLRAR